MTEVAKRALGRTGLDISELAIGGGVVGGILPLGEADAQQRLLSLALANGINWIDTAAAYGQGKSETALGLLLANIPGPQRPHIATKFRLDPTNLNDISGDIEASVTASLKRLQLSSVTLLQLHNPLGGRQRAAGGQALALDDVEKTGGVLDAMDALKAQGFTRHIGFTALGVPDSCQRLIESGRIDTAQVYYNLLNPSAGQTVGENWSTTDFARLIDACDAHGVGVLVIRVFAAGVLATRERHGRESPLVPGAEIVAEEARAERVFEVLGSAHGSRAQAALRFALGHPRIASVILGLSEVGQLEEAIAGAALGGLSTGGLAGLGRLYENDFG